MLSCRSNWRDGSFVRITVNPGLGESQGNPEARQCGAGRFGAEPGEPWKDVRPRHGSISHSGFNSWSPSGELAKKGEGPWFSAGWGRRRDEGWASSSVHAVGSRGHTERPPGHHRQVTRRVYAIPGGAVFTSAGGRRGSVNLRAPTNNIGPLPGTCNGVMMRTGCTTPPTWRLIRPGSARSSARQGTGPARPRADRGAQREQCRPSRVGSGANAGRTSRRRRYTPSREKPEKNPIAPQVRGARPVGRWAGRRTDIRKRKPVPAVNCV